MKKTTPLFFLFLFLEFNSALKAQTAMVRIEPEFTTTDRIMSLSKGMSKVQVQELLKVYPYDILYSSESKCETHVYKVSITRRIHNRTNPKDGSDEQLTLGSPYNDSLRDVLVYFIDGKMEGFISRKDEKKVYEILSVSETLKMSCNPENKPTPPPVPKVERFGCMDKNAVNYDSTATIDNGKCEFCECGYELAKRSELEIQANCPPCLPSKDLWSIWLSDGACQEIKTWVYKYPPLFKRLPADYLKSKDCKPEINDETKKKDCEWCDVLGKGVNANKVTVELNPNR